MKISRQLVYAALIFACAFVGGVVVGRYTFSAADEARLDFAESNTTYKFINPLLFCQDQNADNQTANDIEHAVGDYINQEKSNGDIIDAAFYFRDLNGGPWSLVNPDFRTTPASLLKVPVAITAYQRAEQDPAFLSKKIQVATTSVDTDQTEHFKPPARLVSNTVYTVEDVIEYMLKYSDNTALYILGSMFTVKDLQDSYTRLGIDAPGTDDQKYTMSVKTYASFFRILYNGTYLSQTYSEHLLSLLSQSTFTQGIVAGLPPGITVAHKFGESSAPDGTLRLNDCGIVYKPHQPYLICVMTKGTNYDTLAKVIGRLSKKLYDTLISGN